MDWNPQKFEFVSLSSFSMMITMAASELDETNGVDRGAWECTPLANARVFSEFGHGSTISH